MKSTKKPITLSLFSGAGGLDIGFHNAGFDIKACVEFEQVFCDTLVANNEKYFSDCKVLCRDIRELNPDEIGLDKIDFIIGGPPCQSFSAMGRRVGGAEGFRDKRGGLFEHYVRLVQYYKPIGFLFENVRGIISTNKGKDWKKIVEAFQNIGYKLSYRVLNTADYGVPQKRERMILVGYREGNYRFPKPTNGPDSPNKKPFKTALESIIDLQDPLEEYHHYSGKYGELLEQIPPGQNYHFFTKEMGNPNPVFAWRSRFSDFLYKADPNSPVRTIVAKMGAYSGPFHWKNRRFTIPELKRLQSFPDNYVITGNEAKIRQQIGNSVPPAFAQVLAMSVLENFFDQDLKIELMNEDFDLSFDKRKSQKAIKTVLKKSVSLPLFDFVENTKKSDDNKKQYSYTRLFEYQFSKRNSIKSTPPSNSGTVYKFFTARKDEKAEINVSKFNKKTGSFEDKPLIKYKLIFRNPIGNDLNYIECTLFSDSGVDIPIAWDAIEDTLSKETSYNTMFDIHGHFTEPHPLYDLNMEIEGENPDFIVNFAKEFSSFNKNRHLFSADYLKKIYTNSGGNLPFDFIKTIQFLRSNRFDIRVHETNRIIPPGQFRCPYPFTQSLNRQISISWRNTPTEDNMANDERFINTLQRAYDETSTLIDGEFAKKILDYKKQPSLSRPLMTMKNKKIIPLGLTVAEGIETIINNLQSNKYLYSILVTSLVYKLVNPKQDIRYAQSNGMPGGYSNRSTDQTHITPFLKRVGLTHCEASGMESGRNFERPIPLKLDFPGKPRGAGNREAILGILNAVEEDGVDPFPCLVYLMALDRLGQKDSIFEYPIPKGYSIQEIVDLVVSHFNTAVGNGKARLPVLAIQAIYMCIVPELARYKEKILLPVNRLTANDKLGWIGDVQVNNPDNTPFEAVEVKSGKSITSSMINTLPRKFVGQAVNRYYILSTELDYISEENRKKVETAVMEIQQMTGCEIIPNGLIRSLWYYLRLVTDKDKFIDYYTELVENDVDVHKEHKELWSKILKAKAI